MKRNISKLSDLKYYALTVSTLRGLLVYAAMIMLFGGAGVHADLPPVIISVMLSLSLASGGLLSGYTYGRRKRHGGIKGGIICGAIMFAVIWVFGIFYIKVIPPLRFLRYLPLLCVSGSAGCVGGVNSRIKHPPV